MKTTAAEIFKEENMMDCSCGLGKALFYCDKEKYTCQASQAYYCGGFCMDNHEHKPLKIGESVKIIGT